MPDPTPRAGAFTLCDEDLSLATDLYQLTMAAAYHARPTLPRATFELFVRRLPRRRSFLVFAGLEQALGALAGLRFDDRQIDYLRGLPPFREVDDDFFRMLRELRFRGDVWAMREGTVFFPDEPVLRVTGSLIEAQIVETLLLSIVNFQTAIASKAARVRLAAGDRVQLAEFGGRRAHGPQGASWVARTAYLGGFDSTSNVLAGHKLGIPVVGTMAHSFILAFPSEEEAFRAYQRVFPEHTILLVDTYDTLDGVRKAVSLGVPFAGIRLDSGDYLELARGARRILDDAGRPEAKIFASGDMSEDRIADLLSRGAPIDAFGVGTQLATSADAPYVGGIYKLVELEEEGEVVPKFKTSAGKATWPGRKQVLRRIEDGRMAGDRIVPLAEAASEPDAPGAGPLLRPVMRGGEPVVDETVHDARRHLRRELERLPAPLRRLDGPAHAYPVEVSPRLEEIVERELARMGQG